MVQISSLSLQKTHENNGSDVVEDKEITAAQEIKKEICASMPDFSIMENLSPEEIVSLLNEIACKKIEPLIAREINKDPREYAKNIFESAFCEFSIVCGENESLDLLDNIK